MALGLILYEMLIAPCLWLASTLLLNLLLILTLTILWRAYKTTLVRKVGLLRRWCLKPVDARQVILITGASSGIGLALTKYLFKLGYSVVATYLDQRDPGFEELRQLQASSGNKSVKRLFIHQLDVINGQQRASLYETVARELDQHQLHLYALVNNAGVGSLQPFAWLQRSTIQRIIDTNITGSLMMTREFLPLLIKRKSGDSDGRLLFVSSGLGLVPGATYATYGVTKIAQIYFSRCMNFELKERYGIQSVAVVPHNFIKNTNICAQNVKSNQLAWDEMKPIERELYAREHQQQLELVRSLERATIHARNKQSTSSSSMSSSNGQQNKKADKATPTNGGTLAALYSFLRQIVFRAMELSRGVVATLKGENVANTLDESGILECFEDALRLRDPPEQIFAGDVGFQLIMSSILLLLPQSCVSLFSSSVAPALYK